MFRNILTESQQTVLERLSRIAEVRTFYLAGGTALALRLGHRRSGGFDFFRPEAFTPQDLLGSLRTAGEVQVLQETARTVTVMVQTVPARFVHYDYPLLKPLQHSPWTLAVADPEDIAAMKLFALAGRGSRKDFVDLFVYAQEVASLERVFDRFRAKYRGIHTDPYHLLRSLTFFDDAEAEAMPDVVRPIHWDEITSFFRAEAVRLFRTLPS